jgi:phytanoyl-CoA dioxygenase PhyH
MSATLSYQQTLRDEYATEGYLHVRGILSPGLVHDLRELLQDQFETQAAYLLREIGIDLTSPAQLQHFLDSRDDHEAWFETQSRAMQHVLKGEFPLEARLDRAFLRVGDERALTDLLRALLDDTRLRLHYPPMLRFKVPQMNQARVPLHQDGPYFPHIQNFVNVWIPFSPITEACGGVNVLAGSHRLGPLQHKSSVLWGNYVPRELAGDSCPDRHILMELGDVLIFGPNLLHYTHENVSERVRFSLDSRWFGSATASSRQYYDVDARAVVRMF